MLVVAGITLTQASAYASAVYDFDLVWGGSGSGPDIFGTGSVTFDNAIPLINWYSAATNDQDGAMTTKIDSFSISMSDGASFNLTTDPAWVGADFIVEKGQLVLESLSYYYGPSNSNVPRMNINGLTYDFQPNAFSTPTLGSITDFVDPPTPAPEPVSALLALPALMLFAVWRVRKAVAKS